MFKNLGYQIVDFEEKADIYVINTCTVTKEADRKSKQMIRRAIQQNLKAKIVVTGCYAQSDYQDLQGIEGISLIAGNEGKNTILSQLNNLPPHQTVVTVEPAKKLRKYENSIPPGSTSLHTRAWVKIQDGCNKFCSYCKVPYVRGPARSRSIKDIEKEISALNDKEVKEVVLLGINLGAYGTDLDTTESTATKKVNLSKIIALINDFKNIERIRLSSIESIYLDKELLEAFIKYPKLCHHLHIPLQSGDDKILRLMNRPYNTTFFYQKIQEFKENIPDLAITSDIMVGFPYEDEASFNNTYNLVKKLEMAKIHVFQYSDRQECLANLLIDKIEQKTKKERSEKLLNLSRSLSYNFIKKWIGLKTRVLVEKEVKDREGKIYSQGTTDNYIKVIIPELTGKVGKLVSVRLEEAYSNYGIAKVT